MLRLRLSLLLAVSLGYLTAQVDLDQVHRFPGTEVLPTVIIKKVVEGPFGFVWIATSDGLYRFDGSRLRLMFGGNYEDIDIDEANSILVFTGRDSLILYNVSGTRTEAIPRDSLIEGDHMLQTTQILSDSVYLVGSSYGLTHYNIKNSTFHSNQLIGEDGLRDHVILAEQDPSDADVVWVGIATSIGGYANWTNVSDKRFKTDVREDIPGLDFIMALNPVSYQLNLDVIDDFVNHPGAPEDETEEERQFDLESRAIKESIRQSGFIAQEVEQAALNVNYEFSGVDAPKNENDFYGLRYAEFVVPLVKAVQELSAENDLLKRQLSKQQARIDELTSMENELIEIKAVIDQLLLTQPGGIGDN